MKIDTLYIGYTYGLYRVWKQKQNQNQKQKQNQKNSIREGKVLSVYYHATPNYLNGKLRSNYQGIHLSETPDGAKSVMKNKEIDNYHLYEVQIKEELHPLVVDYDPMDWSSLTVAKMLMAKLYNRKLEGAFGKPDKEGNTYKYNIPPTVIHMDNLTNEDIQFVCRLSMFNADDNFNLMGKFLTKKGYNCIEYPLAEDDLKSKAILVWDSTLLGDIYEI